MNVTYPSAMYTRPLPVVDTATAVGLSNRFALSRPAVRGVPNARITDPSTADRQKTY
jgi:hypothetical protein